MGLTNMWAVIRKLCEFANFKEQRNEMLSRKNKHEQRQDEFIFSLLYNRTRIKKQEQQQKQLGEIT